MDVVVYISSCKVTPCAAACALQLIETLPHNLSRGPLKRVYVLLKLVKIRTTYRGCVALAVATTPQLRSAFSERYIDIVSLSLL